MERTRMALLVGALAELNHDFILPRPPEGGREQFVLTIPIEPE